MSNFEYYFTLLMFIETLYVMHSYMSLKETNYKVKFQKKRITELAIEIIQLSNQNRELKVKCHQLERKRY